LPHETRATAIYAVSMSARGRLPLRVRSLRRPSVSRNDVLVAAGVGVIQVAVVAAGHRNGRAGVDAGTYALLVASSAALLLRRTHPRATLSLVLVASLVYWLLGYPGDALLLAQIVAFMGAIMRGHRMAGWFSLILGYTAYLGTGHLTQTGHASPAYAVGLAAWLLALGAGAELIRVRTERVREARRRRRQESLRRIGDERLRIARELHDVLAHNVSLISVQAGVALHLLDEHPEKAEPALKAIKSASAETLREMRSVLGTLRRPDEHAPRSPAPSLSRLDELVTRMGAVGLSVEIETDGAGTTLPAAVDLAAYRIVQEALTNVARHSEATTAFVQVRHRENGLEVEVSNDDRRREGEAIVDGNGIIGMRERALGLGGEFSAAHRPRGGFTVRTYLPFEELR
jgi:signal transduction histidine kinase